LHDRSPQFPDDFDQADMGLIWPIARLSGYWIDPADSSEAEDENRLFG